MAGFRKDVSSVTALVTFEAAARLRSFTLAARELGVTQAAVSRQIRNLESDLGFAVFRRQHRRVELTEAGSILATTLSRAFEQIGDSIRLLKHSSKVDELTICATVAVSHFWLMPLISDFRSAHPGLRLRIIAQDAPADPDRDGVDVLLRYHSAPPPAGKSVLLATDEVFPVCSPEFLRREGRIDSIEQLLRQPLITTDPADPSWIGWSEWMQALERPQKVFVHSLRLSHYTDAIFAAVSGQGVALGWGFLVARALQEKSLVRVTREAVAPAGGYYLVVPDSRVQKPAAADFVRWAGDILVTRIRPT
jgi:DNA-binding transcriptional LysR family regulator